MPTNAMLLEKNVPEELKKLSQWVLWKKNKIPVTVNDSPASTTNSADWSSFEDAIAEYVMSSAHRGILGVGFVFVSGCGVVGIDLDKAIDEKGIKPWALKVLSLFEKSGAYVEYSPSGKGFHILVLGKKPGTKCKRVVLSSTGETLGEIEMYETARYFTFTGELYQARFNQLVNAQAVIDHIYERVFGGDTPEPAIDPSTTVPVINTAAAGDSLPDLYSLIRSSAQAEKFRRLTEGSLEDALSGYGGDHSRAVYALCSVVAFYTSNFSLMDCIFQGSPLFADKWADKKWARLGASQFRKLRGEYEAKQNFYNPEAGKIEPSKEFSETELEEAKDKGEAEYERHIELLWLSHGDARRDLLSRTLFLRAKSGEWISAFNRSTLSSLRGECQVRGKLYKKTKLEDYLYRFEQTLDPQLLIDVPKWDNQDRIGEMARRLTLKECEPRVFEEMLKDWCAKMWGRIHNPAKVQNRCIILSGRQGIGKDYWVKSMFFGLEKYLTDLTLAGQQTKETDIAVVMASSLVMFISEFDKTNNIGVDTLKDLISKESFGFVRKYDREASTLVNRCSIIAACNPEHVLRDVTGNRRFLVFKLEGDPGDAIKWTYPFMDSSFSLQVISQCKELWTSGYAATQESERAMAMLTKRYTPDDCGADIVSDFESMVESRLSSDPLSRQFEGLFKVEMLDAELNILSRNYGLARRTVLATLKGAGCQYRNSKGRWYGKRVDCDRGAELTKEVSEREVDTSVFE